MTRENKVALVVGFALVLLAGILISDHFSKARLDRPADLAVRRTAEAGLAPAMGELIDLSPYFRLDEPAGTAPSNASDQASAAPAAGPAEGARARPPAEPPPGDGLPAAGPATDARQPGAAPAPPLAQEQPAPVAPVAVPAAARQPQTPGAARLHEVQPGEALSVICQHYYRDQTLIEELAAHNSIRDLDHLRAGVRLRIPAAAELTGRAPAAAADPAVATAPKRGAERTCTVEPGETLMQLAARHLGSRSRWRELYEANRAILDDPDSIEAGTVLQLPGAKR